MTKPKILSEEIMSMTEVKAELNKIKKKQGDLNYRANKTDEYLGQFKVLTQKKAKELKEKIESLNIPRLKDQYVIKLVDMAPTTEDEVKLVMQSFTTLSVSQDSIKKLAKGIKEIVD
ncbi:hypothetical protein H6504_04160 [Candidatus Woesearchaeota archaeon]|nr:hypothetical protein [Candidatus Woesearchaeota archaeon]